MRACIVYSSATGNTEKLARALSETLHFPIYSVDSPPDWHAFECLVLGFWVLRGLPDPKMQAFMRGVVQKTVFFFATHAAWVESEHVRKCKEAVSSLLLARGNTLIGSFTCQGRVKNPNHHPMTPERRARLEEASRHPNAEDLAACIFALRNALCA